jgi:predicted nucleic acid-binding protein
MAASVIVDASFLVALFSDKDVNHGWAASELKRFPPPWKTCEAALCEAFHLVGSQATRALVTTIRRTAVTCGFQFGEHATEVLRLMEKYEDVPMSFADACLVRMTEMHSNPILLTTDTDFRIYRRHGRQVVPCIMPK